MFVRADSRSFQHELAKEQDQAQPAEELPTSGINAADLSRIAGASTSKRKYSIGSSVATQGSSRADFSETETFQWGKKSEAEYGNEDDEQELQAKEPTTKSPEMQEVGGSAPFLTRPNYTAPGGSVEMVDIDMEVEHHEG